MFKKAYHLLQQIILVFFLLSAYLVIGCSADKTDKALEKITIATLSPSFTSYLVYIAQEQGFFQEEGLDAELKIHPHGKASLKAVIHGKADLATSSETPFVREVLAGTDLAALATMISAAKHLAVVARKDSGITKPRDMSGKKIGVTLGSNGEYFLNIFLLINNMSFQDIRVIDVKPSRMYEKIIQGQVDAVATWNPQINRIHNSLGENSTIFYTDGMYNPYFLLVGNKSYLKSNPGLARKVIRALIRSEEYARTKPEQAARIVAQIMGYDSNLLNQITGHYDFNVSLSQAFLKTLEHQGRWMLDKTNSGERTLPNFLDHIYQDALLEVRPVSVTIFR